MPGVSAGWQHCVLASCDVEKARVPGDYDQQKKCGTGVYAWPNSAPVRIDVLLPGTTSMLLV